MMQGKNNENRSSGNKPDHYRKLVMKIKKRPGFPIDELIHQFHLQVFEVTDCLTCARCCRVLGPRLTDRDVARLSGFLRMKPSVFTETYLKIDEDNDYIFRAMPCPFIGDDNYCSVYQQRPSACRDYPHTSRSNIRAVLDVMLKDAAICPAVSAIMDKLGEMNELG